MKRNKQMFQMILTAIFAAIIFLLSLVPNVGYIIIVPGIALTIIHIPVIIGFFILPITSSLFLGLSFGLSSLIVAATQGVGSFDQAFINPLISVLPRMLFAAAGHYILVYFKRLATYKHSKVIIFSIVSVVMSVAIFFSISFLITSHVNSQQAPLRAEIEELIDEENYDVNYYNDLMTELNELVAKGNKTLTIVYSLTGALIILIVGLTFYLMFYSKYKKEYYYIPSVFILSTFIHTILVLAAVVIIKPSAFFETFGQDMGVMRIILLVALTNGLGEALVAAVIGTPIVVAVMRRMGDDDVIAN